MSVFLNFPFSGLKKKKKVSLTSHISSSFYLSVFYCLVDLPFFSDSDSSHHYSVFKKKYTQVSKKYTLRHLICAFHLDSAQKSTHLLYEVLHEFVLCPNSYKNFRLHPLTISFSLSSVCLSLSAVPYSKQSKLAFSVLPQLDCSRYLCYLVKC